MFVVDSYSLAVAGCNRTPSVERPMLDTQTAVQRAMDLLDANRDGAIAGSEIDAAPSLKIFAAESYGRLTTEELAKRFDFYFSSSVVMTGVSCLVTLDGRPLEGATVTFEPAESLEGAIEPATGITNAAGIACPAQFGKPALYCGAYDVRISKTEDDQESIPEQYNTRTQLGAEVVLEGFDMVTDFTFPLRSK